jgi:anti-sigma factor RsiW
VWCEPGTEVFVRYLLGELPTPDRDRFEGEYFADDSLHEQLLAVECELIDAYVRGDLSESERRYFEDRYLATPEGRQRVEHAKVLQDYVSREVALQLLSVQQHEADIPQAALLPSQLEGSAYHPINLTAPDRDRSWWKAALALLRFQSPLVRVAVVSAVPLVFILLLLPLALRHPTGKFVRNMVRADRKEETPQATPEVTGPAESGKNLRSLARPSPATNPVPPVPRFVETTSVSPNVVATLDGKEANLNSRPLARSFGGSGSHSGNSICHRP